MCEEILRKIVDWILILTIFASVKKTLQDDWKNIFSDVAPHWHGEFIEDFDLFLGFCFLFEEKLLSLDLPCSLLSSSLDVVNQFDMVGIFLLCLLKMMIFL